MELKNTTEPTKEHAAFNLTKKLEDVWIEESAENQTEKQITEEIDIDSTIGSLQITEIAQPNGIEITDKQIDEVTVPKYLQKTLEYKSMASDLEKEVHKLTNEIIKKTEKRKNTHLPLANF